MRKSIAGEWKASLLLETVENPGKVQQGPIGGDRAQVVGPTEGRWLTNHGDATPLPITILPVTNVISFTIRVGGRSKGFANTATISEDR